MWHEFQICYDPSECFLPVRIHIFALFLPQLSTPLTTLTPPSSPYRIPLYLELGDSHIQLYNIAGVAQGITSHGLRKLVNVQRSQREIDSELLITVFLEPNGVKLILKEELLLYFCKPELE